MSLAKGNIRPTAAFNANLAKGLWLQCEALLRASTLPTMSQLLTAIAERERRCLRPSTPPKRPLMPPPVSVDDVGSLFGVVQALRKAASRDYGMSSHLIECIRTPYRVPRQQPPDGAPGQGSSSSSGHSTASGRSECCSTRSRARGLRSRRLQHGWRQRQRRQRQQGHRPCPAPARCPP